MQPFPIPNVLIANPQFYDYLHMLEFKADGSVELTDGAGQLFNTSAHGKFRFYPSNDLTTEIEFYDLVEVNPYEQEEILNKVEDFRVRVSREEGLFPYRQEVVWKVKVDEEWPCLLYTVRYVFDVDPLEFGRPNQTGNLYYVFEDKELIKSVHYYYARDEGRELTAKELINLGVSQDLF